jgi:hypothetical protein
MGQQTDGTRRRSPGITNIIDTALIGISTVVVVQLLQGTSTDIPLFISLYAFAGAIPMLTTRIVISWFKPVDQLSSTAWQEHAAIWSGYLLALLGIGPVRAKLP